MKVIGVCFILFVFVDSVYRAYTYGSPFIIKDKIRTKIFGEYTATYDALIKAILLVFGITILIQQ